MTHHLIVGTGPAGVVAAESLRKIEPSADITLIGDEPEPPYSRMAIPYLLTGKIDEAGTYLRKNEDHYEQKGIHILQGQVTQINRSKRECQVISEAQNGKGDKIELSYDKLLLACGSRPVAPPIPGLDNQGVYSCWTLADARAVITQAKPGAKVVLVGAGFIACIILEALVKRKVDLSVIEMQDRMVPRMMNKTAGGLLKSWCEDKGVTVHTATKVEGIGKGKSGQSLQLVLDNGQSSAADLVIIATGVKPNTELAADAGIKVDQGVLVNEHLQTNDDHIYAAGDVAQGMDFSTGGYSVQAIQTTAAEHGRIAANNMAGRRHKFPGCLNMNVLDTIGLISSSFGLWMGTAGGDSAELSDPTNYRYLNLQFKDDVLVGANSLGLTEHIGVVRGLIQSRIPLKKWKAKLMQDPTRLMEAYLARMWLNG